MTFDDHLCTFQALCTSHEHGHPEVVPGSTESNSTTHNKENALFESPGRDIYMARDRSGVSLFFTAAILPHWETLVLFSDHKDQPLEHTSVTRHFSVVTLCRHSWLCFIMLCPFSKQDVIVRDLFPSHSTSAASDTHGL